MDFNQSWFYLMTIEKRLKNLEFPFCVQLETCSLNEENFSAFNIISQISKRVGICGMASDCQRT